VIGIQDLPTVNATLNTISAVLLVVGYVLIRRRNIGAHRKVMIAAFSVSVLFLISYLTYHSNAEAVRYQRTGAIRVVYFTVLISHIILAATVPFLAIITLSRGLRADYGRHRSLAVWTLPIWLYVSVTGVIVYWMLYRM
jgi:uncharacterized membrane protein YozB (DUF420 family)